ncbi:unnamed protein product [Nyctereutes procyonoides]|uniref:(raccoon dog) hypothetical protein n=1 Tax=Nyctereutes procyonoides TaxID=34880 RepID=A0A811ZQR6_NYCPR|nr:unnamed protein product [Nyctereutes procyonoides]
MFQAYRFLNATKSNLTRSCWLCYDIRPPFYEGIAMLGQWHQKTQGLTLQSMSGQGLCIGTPSPQNQSLCNDTKSISSLDYHLPQDGWWACSTGLTSGFHGQILNQTKSFCVRVQLLPKIIYHSDEQVLHWFNAGTHRRDRREPISAITIATMLGIGLAGAGTAAINLDTEQRETSISHLQDSLISLSEVVLQKRRGLDLVFLQQGGLCAALNKECCFFIDHSGIVRESMANVREVWLEVNGSENSNKVDLNSGSIIPPGSLSCCPP